MPIAPKHMRRRRLLVRGLPLAIIATAAFAAGAVLAGGSVLGVYGMLLAIPAAACGKILVTEVLMPRVNVVEKLDLRRFNLPIAGLAAIVAAGYLIFGDEVVSLLYKGRYDEGAYLILPFALSGVIKLFYSVPSSVIGGRLPRSALKHFMWLNLAGMGVNVALVVVLIRSMG